MKLISVQGKEKNVQSITKMNHTVDNTNGGEERKYVKAIIVGNNGQSWTEYWELDSFLLLNEGRSFEWS